LRERLTPDDKELLNIALRVRDADTGDIGQELGLVGHTHLFGPGFQFDMLQSKPDDQNASSHLALNQSIERLQEALWAGGPDPDMHSLFGTQTTQKPRHAR